MTDVRLNYTEKGSGDVLVLLHGNDGDFGYFSHQIDFFSEKYRVIAVDTRGHGKSQRGHGEFSLDRFADDLRDFLDEMMIDKASILGFSDGGNIALLFALKYPGYVDKLILNGANLVPSGLKLSVRFGIMLQYIFAIGCCIFDKKLIRRVEMLRLMVDQPHITPQQLAEIRKNVLVIVGRDDMIKEDHSVMIHNNIRGSRLVILEGDHFIADKNPEEFNRAIYDFLNGVGQGVQ